MPVVCWVCRGPVGATEAQTIPKNLPRRLRRFTSQPIHVRCLGEWRDVRPPPEGSTAKAKHAPLRTARTARTAGRLLFAEDLAVLRAISRRQATRWLVRLEQRYGVQAVGRVDGRRGPRRYTTEAALQALGPETSRPDLHLAEVVAELAQRLAEVEQLLARGHIGTQEDARRSKG